MADPFLGEIFMFGGNFAPRGWVFCDGSVLPISQNTALFSLLGTFYGGDGRTTYALPDLRGRVPVGLGQGPGLSDYTLGEMTGSASVTLLQTELPVHTHALPSPVSTNADASAPVTNFPGTPASGTPYASTGGARMGGGLAAATLTPQGGNQAHENRMPYLGINFIICTSGGAFPPRP